MSKTLTTKICECIEKTFSIEGGDYSKRIIVYPIGDVGAQVLNIMNNIYALEAAFLVDSHKCMFSDNIYDLSLFEKINTEDYVVILASINNDIYHSLRASVCNHFSENHILELEGMHESFEKFPESYYRTKIGKYSYGPICYNHPMIESIGSFCSFAVGVDVVLNHEMNFITTHPIIYAGACYEGVKIDYEKYKCAPWFFPGVEPKTVVEKRRRIAIGNDVWLGRNVIITNYSNIGNGVIAAAGAVITKDIPDYAIVAGVPARIIKYRYTSKQIEALNQIAWWDWDDDEIRDRFNDLYLPIDEFINKYI